MGRYPGAEAFAASALPFQQTVQVLVRQLGEINFLGRDFLGWHRRGNRLRTRAGFRGAQMLVEQGSNLTDGPRPHQTRRRQGHPDRAFDQVFNLHPHQRIEAKVGQRLVGAQRLGFDAQHGPHHILQSLDDHRLALAGL